MTTIHNYRAIHFNFGGYFEGGTGIVFGEETGEKASEPSEFRNTNQGKHSEWSEWSNRNSGKGSEASEWLNLNSGKGSETSDWLKKFQFSRSEASERFAALL
jgi:hypothetical protein